MTKMTEPYVPTHEEIRQMYESLAVETGLYGVSREGKKYRVRIYYKGNWVSRGLYPTICEAGMTYNMCVFDSELLKLGVVKLNTREMIDKAVLDEERWIAEQKIKKARRKYPKLYKSGLFGVTRQHSKWVVPGVGEFNDIREAAKAYNEMSQMIYQKAFLNSEDMIDAAEEVYRWSNAYIKAQKKSCAS